MFRIAAYNSSPILRLLGFDKQKVYLIDYEMEEGSNAAVSLSWTNNKETAMQFTPQQVFEILSIVKTAGVSSAFKEKV